MIEKMKKITLIVSEPERAKFVSRLQEAGVVHVKPAEDKEHHEIHFLKDKIDKIDKMTGIVSPYDHVFDKKQKMDFHERGILETADKVADAAREKGELEDGIEKTRKQMLWFETWGEFDPEDFESLKQKGVSPKLYRIKKGEFKKFSKTRKRGSGKKLNLGLFFVVKKQSGYFYVLSLPMGAEDDMPFEEVLPPAIGLRKMKLEIEEKQKGIEKIETFFKEKAKTLKAVKACGKKLKKEHVRLTVKFGMKEEGKFSYLEGYCPVRALGKISAMANRHNMGCIAEKPEDSEEVPTHITNPRWLKIIDPVFKFMNTLPGYEEYDISFCFLLFFSLFFAMIVGDAGYGLIFLGTTFLLRRKFKKISGEPFFLMYVLSIGTIVWGAITGTWFGSESLAKLPVFNALIIGKLNSLSAVNQNFLIFICFVIGAVHLTIAHLFRAVRVINSIRALAQVGWIMILWGMFFAAGKFVLNKPFPSFGVWLFVAGISCVIFCSDPEKGFFKGALGTLANLPLSVIGSFSDVVSYLRLFAVGYATVVVAESFNNMALGGGITGVISAVAAVFILFFGHLLNIALSCMAVIVHGIRLNMLEFSGHLGMQWTGKKYKPFCE